MSTRKKNTFQDLVAKTNRDIAQIQERAKVEYARQKKRQEKDIAQIQERAKVEYARQKKRQEKERAEGELQWAELVSTWKRTNFQKQALRRRAQVRADNSRKLSSEERAQRNRNVSEAWGVREATKQLDRDHNNETGRDPFYDNNRGIKRLRSRFGNRVIKGRKRNLYFGSKGGVYYVSKGRKVYIQK